MVATSLPCRRSTAAARCRRQANHIAALSRRELASMAPLHIASALFCEIRACTPLARLQLACRACQAALHQLDAGQDQPPDKFALCGHASIVVAVPVSTTRHARLTRCHAAINAAHRSLPGCGVVSNSHCARRIAFLRSGNKMRLDADFCTDIANMRRAHCSPATLLAQICRMSCRPVLRGSGGRHGGLFAAPESVRLPGGQCRTAQPIPTAH